jgi:hypothetical protein
MPDAPRRERRSPMVMLLDFAMRLALAAQTGPEPKLVPAGRARRVGVGWLVAGAVLAVAGTGVIVGALVTGRFDLASLPPHAAARQPAAAPAPAPAPESVTPTTTGPAPTGTTSGPPSPSGAASASTPPGGGTAAPAPPPVSPAAPAPLTAVYAYTSGGTGLLGYAADVSVANPGRAARDGWQLTVTLPRPSLRIADVTGAAATQDGATWTFEPDATTRTVPAGGSVRITFEVRGATLLAAAPEDCRIDGRPCAGLDDTTP